MFLLMSRSMANHDRGSWSVDFKSYDRGACETMLAEHERSDREWRTLRERIVVKIEVHSEPSL